MEEERGREGGGLCKVGERAWRRVRRGERRVEGGRWRRCCQVWRMKLGVSSWGVMVEEGSVGRGFEGRGGRWCGCSCGGRALVVDIVVGV